MLSPSPFFGRFVLTEGEPISVQIDRDILASFYEQDKREFITGKSGKSVL
jgi:hypothetical protein